MRVALQDIGTLTLHSAIIKPPGTRGTSVGRGVWISDVVQIHPQETTTHPQLTAICAAVINAAYLTSSSR